MQLTPKTIAYALPFITAILALTGILSISSLVGDSYVHDRFVNISDVGVILPYFILLLCTMALDAWAIYRIAKAKQIPALLVAGNVTLIICSLLIIFFFTIVGSPEHEDVPEFFSLFIVSNFLSLVLYRLYRSPGKALNYILIGVLVVYSVYMFLFQLQASGCTYRSSNGKHISYWPDGSKQSEYTLECGDRIDFAATWYENGQLESYERYNGHVLDSSISYYQYGSVKEKNVVPRNSYNHAEYQYNENGTVKYMHRYYDSVVNGRKDSFEMEAYLDIIGKPVYTHLFRLRNDSFKETMYYTGTGQVKFEGVRLTGSSKAVGKWYRYNPMGKIIDSTVIPVTEREVPDEWMKN